MYLYKENKSPYFQLVYLVNGKRKKVSTKCKLKKDALEFLYEYQSKINQVPKSDSVLLSDFRAEFINSVTPKLSAKYIKSIEVALLQLESFTGNIYINEITSKNAEQFIYNVFTSSKYMAAAHYRCLKGAFSKALDWKYIIDNPFKKFKLPKLPTALPVFINYNDLLLIIDKTKDQVIKDVFFTGFFTGLRLAELLNLRWNMIDFTSRMITLKQSESFTTKSKRERIIPINNALFEILSRISESKIDKNNDSLVFTNAKQMPLLGDWISKSFKRAVRAAKLNDSIHFHSLRHGFASSLIQSGVSLYVVKELLGHKDFTTTQIYSHIITKNLSDAVKNLEPEKLQNKNDVKGTIESNPLMKYDICLN